MRSCILVVSLLTFGCGAQIPYANTRHNARFDANVQLEAPSLMALPELDLSKASVRLQSGISIARELLSTVSPAAPSDRRFAQLQSWVERELTPWLASRREGVSEARFEFGLAQGQDASASREGVVARAVLGIVQEDTARTLEQIPAPSELDSEPEVRAVYQEIVQKQAQPFRSAALREYSECAKVGSEHGGELRAFAEFCRARVDHLRAAALSTPTASMHSAL